MADPKKTEGATPDKLLKSFSSSHIVLWLVIAIAVHLFLIGGTSAGYIHDRYILGKSQEEIKQERDAAREQQQLEQQATATAATAGDVGRQNAGDRTSASDGIAEANGEATGTGDNQPSVGTADDGAPGGTETSPGKMTEAELLEKHKNSSVVKAITATAKPEEIPKTPDDLGISIKETNPY